MQCRPISAGTGLQQCLATLRPPCIGSCRSVGPADHPVSGTVPELDSLDSRHLSSPASSGRGLVRRHLLVRPLGARPHHALSIRAADDYAGVYGVESNVPSPDISTKPTDA